VTVIVTACELSVTGELELSGTVPLVELLDVDCDVLLAGMVLIEDELLDVEIVDGVSGIALFVAPVPVSFELCDEGSIEKACCGKTKVDENIRRTKTDREKFFFDFKL